MKRIGIFGGTFDPVHFGHFHLALSLFEKRKLDEVWWMPAQGNPLKTNLSASSSDRLAMLRLAIQDLAMFKVLDIELKRQAPSYTIESLQEIKKIYPSYQFHLLLGDDILPQLEEWKEVNELIRLAPPLIGARRFRDFPTLSLEENLIDILKRGWTEIPIIEISATDIRRRLQEKEFCGHLLPLKVLDYIASHHLYSFA